MSNQGNNAGQMVTDANSGSTVNPFEPYAPELEEKDGVGDKGSSKVE